MPINYVEDISPRMFAARVRHNTQGIDMILSDDPQFTRQSYLIPASALHLNHAVSVVDNHDGVVDSVIPIDLTSVPGQGEATDIVTGTRYVLTVSGSSVVHSTLLADYEWITWDSVHVQFGHYLATRMYHGA